MPSFHRTERRRRSVTNEVADVMKPGQSPRPHCPRLGLGASQSLMTASRLHGTSEKIKHSLAHLSSYQLRTAEKTSSVQSTSLNQAFPRCLDTVRECSGSVLSVSTVRRWKLVDMITVWTVTIVGPGTHHTMSMSSEQATAPRLRISAVRFLMAQSVPSLNLPVCLSPERHHALSHLFQPDHPAPDMARNTKCLSVIGSSRGRNVPRSGDAACVATPHYPSAATRTAAIPIAKRATECATPVPSTDHKCDTPGRDQNMFLLMKQQALSRLRQLRAKQNPFFAHRRHGHVLSHLSPGPLRYARHGPFV